MQKFLLKATTLLTLIIAFTSEGTAQNHTLRAVKELKDGAYNFWVYTPLKYDSLATHTPIVMFLHGQSLCGGDMNRVRRYGPLHAVKMGLDIGALVVVPHNPGGAWCPQRLDSVMTWVKANYKADTTRVYVIGMSLGAYGTLDYAAAHPETTTAAIAICGGCSASDKSPLGKLPLWIIHGTADRAVPITKSKEIVESLKSSHLDTRLRYTWLKGANHSSPARIFYMKKTYEWLYSHSLSDPGRPVNQSISIDHTDLPTAYKGLRSGLPDPQFWE